MRSKELAIFSCNTFVFLFLELLSSEIRRCFSTTICFSISLNFSSSAFSFVSCSAMNEMRSFFFVSDFFSLFEIVFFLIFSSSVRLKNPFPPLFRSWGVSPSRYHYLDRYYICDHSIFV